MGLLDNVKNLVGGSGRTFVDIPLEPGEHVVLDKVGCVIRHGIVWKGGQLRLTNRRLLLRPWNTADTAALLTAGLKASGAPGPAVALVGWLQGQNSPEANQLDAIASVAAGGGPSLMKPPTIVITLSDGRTIELGVMAGITVNLSPKNTPHRDELLAALTR